MVAVQIQRTAGLGDIIRAGAEHIVCSGFDNTAIDRGGTGIGAGGGKGQGVRAILCQTARAGEVEIQGVIVATLENHLALIVYDTLISSHGSPVVDDGLSCQCSPGVHL
ncbi:outer membrane autotransporter barrel -containing domain protein [Yersinia frederiksenii ATCC 33641]|uniref:Outer membrane autotransporter barrel-containing domain protein n=1 Tax=Yersinia frederiksenii ATCC 33641 TaxID=349966 RepID=A0ABR4VWB3_YERFR|nr:outer membrane autotransporter barrel -containing domain protein [Yersinia frederiksenii ATCC 33641]